MKWFAALKEALHELAEKHRYWKRVDDVIAELEAAGFKGTSESADWAAEVFS